MKLTQKQLVGFLYKLQNECDLHANSLATKAIAKWRLIKAHKKLVDFEVLKLGKKR